MQEISEALKRIAEALESVNKNLEYITGRLKAEDIEKERNS